MPIKGDYGYTFVASITDQDGAPLDLTGAAVVFRFSRSGRDDVEKAGVIGSPASAGVASYTVESGLFDEAGLWSWQVVVTLADAQWTTTAASLSITDPI